VDKDETLAACALGMPPVPTNHLKLKRFSRYTPSPTCIVWAIAQAAKDVKNM